MKVNHHYTPKFREDVAKAIKGLSDMVGDTLGPGGGTVLLKREGQAPMATKDGVTVAQKYATNGGIDELVVDASREVCERSAKTAGDGTTTAIVIASALVQAGHESNTNPQAFSREIKAAYEKKVKPYLENLAKPIRGLPEKKAMDAVYKVAFVSANGDDGIARNVAEATRAVGEDGVIEVEEGAGNDIRWVRRDGFGVGVGLNNLGGSAGPAFVNRQDKNDCAMSNVLVALYDGDVNDIQVILPLLEKVVKEKNHPSLLIFAHQYSDTVLKHLAHNLRKGVLNVLPMKTPRGGAGPVEALRDIAAYTGGKVYDPQAHPIQDATIDSVGFVDEVRTDQHETRLIGEPLAATLDARITELKSRLEGANDFDAGLIRYRIGRLTSGVATLYAGGTTAFEAQERRDRAVDAVSAVRCALEAGVVPGGGCALLMASATLDNTGAEYALKQALSEPFQRILKNAGIKKNPLVGGEPFKVYDAIKRKRVEWWRGGIMDPLKVTMGAAENAISVAQMLLSLRGAVGEKLDAGEQQVRAMQEGMSKMIEGQ
jgi:chaperonin GroEL